MRPLLRVITAAWPGPHEPRRARFLEDLHVALAGRFASEVLAPRVYEEDPEEELRAGIPVVRVAVPFRGSAKRAGIGPARALSTFAALELAARGRWPGADRRRGGLVLAHWLLPAGSIAARLARRLRLPLVLYAHGSDVHTYGRGAIGRALIRRALAGAALVIVASEALAAMLRPLAPPGIRLEVIPVGIHPAFVASAEPPPSPPPVRVLFVGDPLRAKGADTLSRAVRRALGAGIPVELSWIGATAPELPEPGVGRALGALAPEEVAREMARAHLLILPSENEGTPVSIQEAIAMRLSWAATPVGGIPALARDWPGGMLLPAVEDGAALETAIVALLGSFAAAGEAGVRARRQAMAGADPTTLGVASRAAILADRLEEVLA